MSAQQPDEWPTPPWKLRARRGPGLLWDHLGGAALRTEQEAMALSPVQSPDHLCQSQSPRSSLCRGLCLGTVCKASAPQHTFLPLPGTQPITAARLTSKPIIPKGSPPCAGDAVHPWPKPAVHGWTKRGPLQPLRKSKDKGETQRVPPAGENPHDLHRCLAWVLISPQALKVGRTHSILVQTSEPSPCSGIRGWTRPSAFSAPTCHRVLFPRSVSCPQAYPALPLGLWEQFRGRK